MMDRESGRELQNAIEVHTVELTKYNLEETTISQAIKLEQWAFLLLRAQDYSAHDLTRLLPSLEFETAINTIQIISEKTEDKQMYDQREKAQRDYEWALSGAREEGREEGEQLGVLKGKIQMLQQLLGESPATDDAIKACDLDALASQLAELQERLRARPA
jgi:predicted transposase/invertase (TIGR01784 family)